MNSSERFGVVLRSVKDDVRCDKTCPSTPSTQSTPTSRSTLESKLKELKERRAISKKNTSPHSLREDDIATVVEEHEAENDEEMSVFVGDVVQIKLSRGGWHFAAEDSTEEESGKSHWVLIQKGHDQGIVPSHKLQAGLGRANLKAGRGRDRHTVAKSAAKYDAMAEALAQHWIEQVTGVVFDAPFGDQLQDGVLLCHLLNKIQPNTISKIYHGKTPFCQMDNIAKFLSVVDKMGVRKTEQFETIDLFERRDLNGVLDCLFALSRLVVSTPESFPNFTGPYLNANPDLASSIKVIVAVNDYRDRNWSTTKVASSESEKKSANVLRQATEYRRAMLDIRSKKMEADATSVTARAVHRIDLKPASLVVWSSSANVHRDVDSNQRRLEHILAVKRKRYELVYVDIAPERKQRFVDICGKKDDVSFPALTLFDDFIGDFETIQRLEDDGALDAVLASVENGTGFWLLPEAWSNDGGVGSAIPIDDVPNT